MHVAPLRFSLQAIRFLFRHFSTGAILEKDRVTNGQMNSGNYTYFGYIGWTLSIITIIIITVTINFERKQTRIELN
jgi:hypothetical protein